MLTNANIMTHSSYDNLSLISPTSGPATTNTNPIFDELQGRGQVSRFFFITLINIYMHNFVVIIYLTHNTLY
jgi:hypothetical protein